LCRDAGLTEEQIEAIPSWSTADCFSPLERAVLAYIRWSVASGAWSQHITTRQNDTRNPVSTHITASHTRSGPLYKPNDGYGCARTAVIDVVMARADERGAVLEPSFGSPPRHAHTGKRERAESGA
jgi:alkylhydroperoxidase family enzyme